MTATYTRSPRIISLTGTSGDSTSVELYLWNDPNSIPTDPQYTLSKDVIGTKAYYDVSPYAREYISHRSFTDISTGTQPATVTEYCYLTVKTYKNAVLQSTLEYICFDGYGYHADGYNPTVSPVLLDAGEYYCIENEESGSVYVYDDGTYTWTGTYTGLTTGGTTNVTFTNTIGHIPLLHTNYASEGNTLEIKRNGTTLYTYTATVECEPKYTPVECDFVNRYGMWQRLIFFKASKESMEVMGEEYKMHPESISYKPADNIEQAFNTNGKESIVCNTGWVREGYSEVLKQLLLSEKVLIDGVAVKVNTNSIEKFKHINEKNINYQIEFKHTHDIINYVI